MNEELKIQKSHCNECGHKTNHKVIFNDIVEGRDDKNSGDDEHPYYVQWRTDWRLLKCCGCDDVSLEKTFWFSENCGDGQDPPEYYPPRIARKKQKWLENLPDEYPGLLNEIYSALHADNRRLSMMGARAIVDIFINRKVGDLGNFTSGMKALQKEGYISEKNRVVLEAAIEVGNATTHREHKPTSEQVSAVMDIIENLIQHDVLQKSAESLRGTTPKRQKKDKTV